MSDSRWVRQGVQVGLIAFVTVALFYAAFDVLASRGALYSVNQLGRAVAAAACATRVALDCRRRSTSGRWAPTRRCTSRSRC